MTESRDDYHIGYQDGYTKGQEDSDLHWERVIAQRDQAAARALSLAEKTIAVLDEELAELRKRVDYLRA